MKHTPSIGEITGAIILTATFAVAASILYVTFQEKTDQIQYVQSIRHEQSAKRAAELLDTDMVQCGAGFILHNYAAYDLDITDFSIYKNDTGIATLYNASYHDMDGMPSYTIPAGRSVWVNTEAIPCGTSIILVTPGGQRIEVSK